MIPIQESDKGVSFQILVQPRASRCEVAGIQGNALKVKITAPPVEGQANLACIRFLAEAFAVKRGQVTIITGEGCRKKTIAIKGLTGERAAARIAALTPGDGM